TAEDAQLLSTVGDPFHIHCRVHKISVKIFLAGQVRSPGGYPIGTIVDRPHDHGASWVGGRLEEGMSGGGCHEVVVRLPCDTLRILRGAYYSPTALSEGDLDHRHAVCGLRLGDFVRCPGLHTTAMQQSIVSVFMIDGEQPPGRV